VALIPSQNVALIPSQNLAPNPIQNAASISQNAAFNQATPINQAASIKQAALIKHAIPKHAISINQILYISASHFLNASVIQSINIWPVIQHLIACLVIIISTLSAREIG
jgi:hypothetical protein